MSSEEFLNLTKLLSLSTNVHLDPSLSSKMALLFFFLSSLSASFPFSLLRHTCMQLDTVTNSVQWCCASEFSWRLHWLFQFLLFTLLCRMTSVMVSRRPTLWSSRSTSWILSRNIEFWVTLFVWLFSWGTNGFLFSSYIISTFLLGYQVFLRRDVMFLWY